MYVFKLKNSSLSDQIFISSYFQKFRSMNIPEVKSVAIVLASWKYTKFTIVNRR